MMENKQNNNTLDDSEIFVISNSDEQDQDIAIPVAKDVSFAGRKYVGAIGRRKEAVAQVRIFQKGQGALMVNNQQYKSYFPQNLVSVLFQPLKTTGLIKDVDVSVVVSGGGKKGQAQAIRHGIARALVKIDEELRSKIKSKGWLTRDSRIKERKKPGLKKARRAPQWAKR